MKIIANIAIVRWAIAFNVGVFVSGVAWAETKPVEMIVSLKSAKTVTVRALPNQEANAIAFVENGKVIIRKGQEETNGFVMVQLADGRTGWTKNAFLAPSNVTAEQPQVLAAPQGAVTAPAAAEAPITSAPPVSITAVLGKLSVEFWGMGLVGMLIGLLIGAKAGMVYATKSIHERYVVID